LRRVIIICCNLNITKEVESSIDVRYDYNKMDIIGARDELSLIDWETVLQGTVNEGWERLKTYCYGFRASVFHVKPKVKRKSCG